MESFVGPMSSVSTPVSTSLVLRAAKHPMSAPDFSKAPIVACELV
jgi:hypothetical protein